MRVIDGLIILRGHCVQHHLGAAALIGFRLVSLHDLGPKHAACTEFGNLHEIVGRDAHVKLDALCHLAGLKAGIGKRGEPLCAPCKSIAKFLSDVGACIVEHEAVDGEAAQSGHIFHCLHKLFGHGHHIFGELGAMLEETLEGIEAYRAAEVILQAAGLEIVHKSCGYLESTSGTAEKIDFNFLKVYILEKDVNVRSLEVVAYVKAYCISAAVYGIAGVGILLFIGLSLYILTDKPVVVGTCAAHIGELAGKGIEV